MMLCLFCFHTKTLNPLAVCVSDLTFIYTVFIEVSCVFFHSFFLLFVVVVVVVGGVLWFYIII